MMDIIEELRAKGATIVLVTHQMEEVERLCDRILLLKDGKRRVYGTVEEVKKEYGSSAVHLRFSGSLNEDSNYYTISKSTTTTAELLPNKGVAPEEVFKALAAQKNLQVSHFEVQKASLDDIFVTIYQEDHA
jgi:ABC-2 type transport system ATP-binding protein